MSALDVDDAPTTTDLKAGRSSFCRRENHQTCASVQANCTCPCHGRRGQTAPKPAVQVGGHATGGNPIVPSTHHLDVASAEPVREIPPTMEFLPVGDPTPPHQEEATVPDPTPTGEQLQCPECERTFASVHARAVHLARTHKIRSEGRSPEAKADKPAKAPTPPQPKTTPPATVDAEHLVIVTHGNDTFVSRFQTLDDANEIVDLLGQLEITAARYTKAS